MYNVTTPHDSCNSQPAISKTKRQQSDQDLNPDSRVTEVRLGNAVLGFRKDCSKKQRNHNYDRSLHRLRDLERIIRHRHGPFIPEADDSELYAVVAAILHLIADKDGIEESFPAWCRRWMPWADNALIDEILYERLKPQDQPPCDDAIGRMLMLTYEERCLLDIRTIGSYDVTKQERAKRQAEKRRDKDRLRKRRKRHGQGKIPRAVYEANSVERRKPWKDLNISRSTWYRHQRRR